MMPIVEQAWQAIRFIMMKPFAYVCRREREDSITGGVRTFKMDL